MNVRPARPEEVPAVLTVFDSGYLEVTAAAVEAALAADRLLVAVAESPVLGALLLEPESSAPPAEITALAVRPGRRGQGIGTALVAAAVEDHGPLRAAFADRVRPFWASLADEIEPARRPNRFIAWIESSGGAGSGYPA